MNDTEIRAWPPTSWPGSRPKPTWPTVGDDEDLREALDLDSMDFLNFVIALHERTGLPIPEVDVPKLYTYEGVGGVLRGGLNGRAHPVDPQC